MGEAEFNYFQKLKIELIDAAKNFVRGENLSAIQVPKVSNDKSEQLKIVPCGASKERSFVRPCCSTMWTT